MNSEEKKRRIAHAHKAGACPQCDKPIPAGGGIGTGRLDDGLFCSLECFASFHGDMLEERRRLVTDYPEGDGDRQENPPGE